MSMVKCIYSIILITSVWSIMASSAKVSKRESRSCYFPEQPWTSANFLDGLHFDKCIWMEHILPAFIPNVKERQKLDEKQLGLMRMRMLREVEYLLLRAKFEGKQRRLQFQSEPLPVIEWTEPAKSQFSPIPPDSELMELYREYLKDQRCSYDSKHPSEAINEIETDQYSLLRAYIVWQVEQTIILQKKMSLPHIIIDYLTDLSCDELQQQWADHCHLRDRYVGARWGFRH